MKTREEQVEEMAKAIYATGVAWLCDETMRDIRIIMYPAIGKQVRDKQELYDYCIEQAEKELAEEQR